MPRAGDVVEQGVVLALDVRVPEQYSERRARGVSLVGAAEYLRPVGLVAGRSALCAGSPARYVRGEVFFDQGNVLRHAVYHDSDGGAVRFTEYGKLEKFAESVHKLT